MKSLLNLLKTDLAAAEVIGQVVLLSLTVMGISMITVSGMSYIYDLQDMAHVKAAEMTFNLLDMRANQIIIGESTTQKNNVNLGGGSLIIVPNASGTESYITVKYDNDNDAITIPMGKVVQELGDRTIAYEGGGVFSKYPSGTSITISSPGFSYNGETLNIPVMSINGSGYIVGSGYASLSFKNYKPQILFPNASIPNRTNPVIGGIDREIYVNITSDYYDAWADFTRSIGYTDVSTNSETGTISIRLSTVPATLGKDTSITNPVAFRGINTDESAPVNNFSLRLIPYGDKIDWDLHAVSGDKTLIYHIIGDSKNPGDKSDVNVGYQDDGPGYSKPAEIWHGHDKLILQEEDGTLFFDVNLMNTSIMLPYETKNVGADVYKISEPKFNTTGFSWSFNDPQQNKWFFNTSNASWTSDSTLIMGNGSIDMVYWNEYGNPGGNLRSDFQGISGTVLTNWTSPTFQWTGGTPDSVSLYFDWRVWQYSLPGEYYVELIKPDGSASRIYPATQFFETSSWSTKSNTTISVDDFSQIGNYRLKLVGKLQSSLLIEEKVRWDNPTIIIIPTSQLTQKSLSDITSHYISLMAPEGDVVFYQGERSNKGIDFQSTMLINYNSTSAPIYMYLSENKVKVSIE